jgi:uncharacterized protein
VHTIDGDDDVALRLQEALDELPDGIDALDPSAIDGFLVGLVLQGVPAARGFALLLDPEQTAAPDLRLPAVARVQTLVAARWRQLDRAIQARQWFDPWVYAPEAEDAPASQACAPWAAGFALAMHHFPRLMEVDATLTVEALALIYAHFDAGDLEEADELLEHIAALEPAATLEEAIEDLVSATLLLADVVRPRQANRPRGSMRGQAAAAKAQPVGLRRSRGPRGRGKPPR